MKINKETLVELLSDSNVTINIVYSDIITPAIVTVTDTEFEVLWYDYENQVCSAGIPISTLHNNRVLNSEKGIIDLYDSNNEKITVQINKYIDLSTYIDK